MTFTWSELRTAYGPATQVPDELLRAENTTDPLDCLDIVLAQSSFVCDADTLNRGAPPFVRRMFESIRHRLASNLAPWPFLRGILTVMSARASLGDHFGLAPGEGPPLCNAPESTQDVILREKTQRHLYRDVDVEVRQEIDLLASLIRDGASEDRAAATAISILAGTDRRIIRAAVEDAIGSETNLRTRACLQLGWARLDADGSPALSKILRDDLEADGLRSAGAAVACMWREDILSALQDVVVERIRAALSYADPRSSYELFDYAWHQELICGEAARAVWASPLPHSLRIELLTEALEVGVPHDTNDAAFRAPEVSPATPSAWFLMRTGLSRHYHRGSILGPEDLDDSERDVLRRLDRHRNWLAWGGFFPERFGIVSFVSVIGRLLRQEPDALSPLQEGTWARRVVRWSRWKWLRSSIDQTLFGSPAREAAIDTASEIVSELSLGELSRVVLAAAAEPELPYEGILLRFLRRAAECRPEDLPTRVRVGADITDPSRRTTCQLALAAALGTQAEYIEVREAASSVHIGETLRVAIERTLCARGLYE